MVLNEEIDKKIEELRILESQIQSFMAQKQTVQVELNEINNAIEELKKADDEVYKIVSGIMVRSNKANLNKELAEKKKFLEIKIALMEKQEKILEDNSTNIKKEIDDVVSKKQAKNKD